MSTYFSKRLSKNTSPRHNQREKRYRACCNRESVKIMHAEKAMSTNASSITF